MIESIEAQSRALQVGKASNVGLISGTSGHRPDLGVARILPTLLLVQILNCSRYVITLGTIGGKSTDSGLVISGHIWEL